MAYGVTPAGFVPKPLAVIQAELQDDLRATFGAGINLSASSVFGQIATGSPSGYRNSGTSGRRPTTPSTPPPPAGMRSTISVR
jgi:hypothetical protein